VIRQESFKKYRTPLFNLSVPEINVNGKPELKGLIVLTRKKPFVAQFFCCFSLKISDIDAVDKVRNKKEHRVFEDFTVNYQLYTMNQYGGLR